MTEETTHKQRKRNQLMMSMFLILVMVGSTIGFGYSYYMENSANNQQDPTKLKYNGFEFENVNGFWVSSINGNNFIFRYNPQETQSNQVILNKIDSYQNKPVYIYSQDQLSESEISINLNQVAERVQAVCAEGEKCDKDLPVKTCSDNLIIIKESNSSKISTKENCVIIEGNKIDLVKLSDDFLFKTLGIKNN